MRSRYSRWDGTQKLDLDADELLDAMSDDLMADGDPWSALRRMLQRGVQGSDARVPGLRDLLEQLRKRRQQQLGRYDLGSALEDIKKKLDEVLKTERAGIEQRLADARAQVERGEVSEAALKAFEKMAARKREALAALPEDAGGRIRDLQSYEFVDPEAKRQFEELLNQLRQQTMKPFMQGMTDALRNMTPDDLRRAREMLSDLNRMLRERADGGEPDFQAFKDKWGQFFPGAGSLDELMDQMGRQIAQMQSLMASLSPEQRGQLEDMMRSLLLQDERLEAQLAQLAMNLGELLPMDEMRRRYDFRGDEDVSLQEAMRLMDELQRMDQLERQVRRTQGPEDLDKIDPADVERLLGPDARRDLERLQQIAKKLEAAGYLERQGDRLQLTARAIRKIADKALRDVFARLKRDRFGGHRLEQRGSGGDQTDEAKRYEFGDPFLIDLRRTVMNGVERNGPGTPVKLAPADFEVFRTERQTQAATVVMLDMSRSMINNGCFVAAKKVALALAALIRGQFPRDRLWIVGFSLYAREFTAEQLPGIAWSEWNVGTNMHAGFQLSRKLLAAEKSGNRQIIMVTDGEPTAHMEGAEADFAYPPTLRTIQETLKEVQRCTREGIIINTFMLDRSSMLTAFVEQMTRINRGRAFFADPERLGEYVLVDYVAQKRRRS
ncbi:MAG: VWA domain-containing protein [Candidatus Rokubacteria bacterium]|nr:VWA domain-containing protein [Candidatus Rokubacteria bacterium]